MAEPLPTVVKVGGSLYDLPDLGIRLRHAIDQQGWERVVLVPGGGVTARAIRQLDQWQPLGEEAAHWLALQSLALNAHFLAQILPDAVVVRSLAECTSCWQRGQLPILDADAFARADESQPGALPHCWDVTSDSVAVRVAVVLGAARLVLLKSVDLPEEIDWSEAARRGLVDRCFANALATVPVHWVNLRCVDS